ncbi:MAG TPA: 50S ribosomal protein L25 [Rhodothermales bacterium]|nr:50S ribosomal protein L25 [Rhodothermales bacterium]
MQTLNLAAEPRNPGKGESASLRRALRVPAVLYGPHSEPVHFSVAQLDMRPLVHTTETYRVALALGGDTLDCVLKKVDYDPITSRPAHADFFALTKGELLTLTVPVVLVGTPAGIREGGELIQPLHELEVRCLPKDLPGHIGIDISGLKVGDSILIGDLAIEGVEIHGDPTQPVVSLAGKQAELVEDEAVAEEETEA